MEKTQKKNVQLVSIIFVLISIALLIGNIFIFSEKQNEKCHAASYSRVSFFNSVLTGYDDSSYYKFCSEYNSSDNNKVDNYFWGRITQVGYTGSSILRKMELSLEVNCTDTGVISDEQKGNYFYSSSYSLSKNKALVLVWGSNNISDYQTLSNYKNKSSKDLKGNIIASDKTITRSGTSSVNLTIKTNYKYIWYQVIYQWCWKISHSNSYLVCGQSDLFTVDTEAPTCGEESGNKKDNVTIYGQDAYLYRLYYRWYGDEWEHDGEGDVTYLSKKFTQEGIYEYYAEDEAGNTSSTKRTYVDKTGPTATSISNNTFYDTSVNIVYSDNISGVNGIYINDEKKSGSSSYTFSPENEGKYSVYAVDAVGNKSNNTLIIYIDKYAPTLSIAEDIIVNANFSILASDSLSAATVLMHVKKPGEENYTQTNSASFSSTIDNIDGEYYFYATDNVNHQSEIRIITLDRTKPTINIDGQAIANDNNFYNKTVEIENMDLHAKDIHIKQLSGRGTLTQETVYENTKKINIEMTNDNAGRWEIWATDTAGNISNRYYITLDDINDFGNRDKIYNSYKIDTWYSVNLPSYIFKQEGSLSNIAGQYTFENYDDALNWCLDQEYAYRVREQENSWIYISATNESVSQYYYDRSELDKVLYKYASRYISERQIYKNKSQDYYTIKDSDGNTNHSALTDNNPNIAQWLQEDYDSCIFINSSFVFSRSSIAFSRHTITIQYLGDLIKEDDTEIITINFSKSFKENLLDAESYKQGYYEVVEYDECLNKQKYLVYLDIETPYINATTLNGEGEIAKTFNSDIVGAEAGTFYYISFKIDLLKDNNDNYAFLRIQSDRMDRYYTVNDELPELNYETGAGKYTLTLYDRSNNTLEFDILIAGKEPGWTYTSLKDTANKMTIYFTTNNDKNNAITFLEIYKIDKEGTWIQIERDSDDNEINFTCLEYTFRNGGKYAAIIKDLFKRTIEIEPIFYIKGLPSGTLNIPTKSRTNKDVTFQYPLGTNASVFSFDDQKNKIPFTNYYLEYSNSTQRYNIVITANEENSRDYLIFLYSEADDNLFVEYVFTIDTIIAEVNPFNKNDATLEKNGSTNIPFYLMWAEGDVLVKYSIGAMLPTTYRKGEILSQNGLYNFTVRDDVGNIEEFSIYLDSVVNYSIDGKFINIGGVIKSKEKLVVTVNEAYTDYLVASSNGYKFSNSNPILFEGEYAIYIRDNYGNEITLHIELDFTAPEIDVVGVIDKGIVKDAVEIQYEEGSTCKLIDKYGNYIRDLEEGEVIQDNGTYYIVCEDLVGNQSKFEFTIDNIVEFSTNIQNNQIASSRVSFTFLEEMKEIEVIFNGEVIEYANSYSEPGEYKISGEDMQGNKASITFVILDKVTTGCVVKLKDSQRVIKAKNKDIEIALDYLEEDPKSFELNETGDYFLTIIDSELDSTFELELIVDRDLPKIEITQEKGIVKFSKISKPNVTATLTKDGKQITFTEAMSIKDPGTYKLVLVDELGNSNEYNFSIPYKLNTLSIVLIIVGTISAIVITILIVRSRKIKSA